MAIPCAFLYCKWKGKELGEKRRRRLELQFRDWIDSASGHLQAGCSVENAFVKSGRELTYLYDSAADIHREIRSMEHLLSNNIPLEKILYDLEKEVRQKIYRILLMYLPQENEAAAICGK